MASTNQKLSRGSEDPVPPKRCFGCKMMMRRLTIDLEEAGLFLLPLQLTNLWKNKAQKDHHIMIYKHAPT